MGEVAAKKKKGSLVSTRLAYALKHCAVGHFPVRNVKADDTLKIGHCASRHGPLTTIEIGTLGGLVLSCLVQSYPKDARIERILVTFSLMQEFICKCRLATVGLGKPRRVLSILNESLDKRGICGIASTPPGIFAEPKTSSV
eukprot:g31418.t1